MTTGRIVLLAPNWLGDAVMLLPALADVRRGAPGAVVAVAARAGLAPLFAHVAGVDEVVPLAGRGGAGDVFRAREDARRLREGRFDTAILFPNSFQSAWTSRAAGIATRCGYDADLRGRLLTRAVRRPRAKLHQAEYYQALTHALGYGRGPLTARLEVDAGLRERAAALLRDRGWAGGAIVGVAPGAAYGPAKQWPPDRVGRAAARVAGSRGAQIVVVGTAGDAGAAREAAAAWSRAGGRPGGLIDLVGATSLDLLLGVMAHASAFVVNDSGAMHLAAACGVPVTAIFGATDERATAPLPGGARADILTHAVWCRPCLLRACPIDHRCMTGVGVDAVVRSVDAWLDRGASGDPAR